MKKLLARLDLSYLYALLGEATLALTFVFYITIARVLGPEQYGIFAAAIALAAILSLFIQFGLPTLINREVAAHPDEAPQSTVLFLVLQGLTSLGVVIILLPLALILGYTGETLIVCYLAVFSEVCRAAIMTLRSTIKGLGWFRTESVAVAIERLAVVAIATVVLFQTKNLILVIATVVIVRAVNAIGLLYYLSRQVKISSLISRQKLINTLKIAYPFALSGVLWILYYQVDVVMLKSLSTGEETGFYSASYRILEMFSALPRVIFYVIFTRFARYQTSEPEKLPEQIYKATRLLLLAVIPSIVVAGLIQTHLVNILYGEEFSQSVKSLSILLPSLGIKMFGNVADQFLQATGREKKLPRILMAAASTNVVINALLIPNFASMGAAIATLCSECILAILSLRVLAQIGYSRASQNIGLITIVSSVVTAIPSLILYGLTPVIGLGVMIPCIAILLFRMRYKNFLEPTVS
ncbi:polysaccharide biosynthesis family protein [Lyngbya aestuarii BL J]|uniref:Polysaccharide biosynthesis family protein n=1 Tax=Lyngbya aestuarii BL J TaxID=1348334 RepID=U7QDJ6_9CYAN|nr:flippase [Lyngbya aestuarii]ERT04811.1 polysaccharide biosynthesis family protein [Lyngbya aestuarii BL J]